MNVAFQRAAHKVLLDDDNLLPLLHLTVDYQGKDKGESAALCGATYWPILYDTQNLLSRDKTSVVCSSHVSHITPFFPSRVDGPQGRKHATARQLPSRGPAHWLGSPGPHLQGEVAAAHPLHAGRPGEVSAPSDSSLENLSVLFLLRRLTLCVCVCLRYNVVFRYLLSVRRVQSQLQHCWALQMQRKHLKSTKMDAVKWRLRNHMAFLVDNLQYYLQVIT